MLVQGKGESINFCNLSGTTSDGRSKGNLEDLYEMCDTALEVFVDT